MVVAPPSALCGLLLRLQRGGMGSSRARRLPLPARLPSCRASAWHSRHSCKPCLPPLPLPAALAVVKSAIRADPARNQRLRTTDGGLRWGTLAWAATWLRVLSGTVHSLAALPACLPPRLLPQLADPCPSTALPSPLSAAEKEYRVTRGELKVRPPQLLAGCCCGCRVAVAGRMVGAAYKHANEPCLPPACCFLQDLPYTTVHSYSFWANTIKMWVAAAAAAAALAVAGPPMWLRRAWALGAALIAAALPPHAATSACPLPSPLPCPGSPSWMSWPSRTASGDTWRCWRRSGRRRGPRAATPRRRARASATSASERGQVWARGEGMGARLPASGLRVQGQG